MKRFLLLILPVLLLTVLAVPAFGCITVVERQTADTSTNTPVDVPSQNGVPQGNSDIVVSFTANPSTIMSGYASKLTWSCTGATAVRIDPDIGSVGISGTMLVSPLTTTIYILTASNAKTSVTASTQVLVAAVSTPSPSQFSSPPIIHVFTAEPQTVSVGESSILTWNVSNASTIYIDPVVFRQMTSIPAAGSAPVSPAETTVYTLTALNTAGMNSKTLTVTVNAGSQVYLDWEGTWDTEYWGMMYLTQSAGKVTGTYEYQGGKITGYISKNMTNILVGTWSEEPTYLPDNDAGDIEFIMSSDDNSFTGKWRYGSSGGWDGTWVGTRLTPKVLIGK